MSTSRSSYSPHNSTNLRRSMECSKSLSMKESRKIPSFTIRSPPPSLSPPSSYSTHNSTKLRRIMESSKSLSVKESRQIPSFTIRSPPSSLSPPICIRPMAKSVVSADISPALNQSSNGGNRSHRNEIQEDIHVMDNSSSCSRDADGNFVKQKGKAKSVRTHRSRCICETSTVSLPASSEPTDTNSLQELLTHGQKEENNDACRFIEDTTYGVAGMDGASTSQSVERYFHDFISGIKRSKTELKLEVWKEAKSNKLMDKLKRKEAEIEVWEVKELARANTHLKEMEKTFERKRVETMEKLQKRIIDVQRNAEAKKTKERCFTAGKILKVSEASEKPTAAVMLSWWKSMLRTNKVGSI